MITCTFENGTILKCAVGCRIPEIAYDRGMDMRGGGTPFKMLVRRYAATIPVEFLEYGEMYQLLQEAHDKCELLVDGKFNLECLTQRLVEVAYDCNLTFNRPK